MTHQIRLIDLATSVVRYQTGMPASDAAWVVPTKIFVGDQDRQLGCLRQLMDGNVPVDMLRRDHIDVRSHRLGRLGREGKLLEKRAEDQVIGVSAPDRILANLVERDRHVRGNRLEIGYLARVELGTHLGIVATFQADVVNQFYALLQVGNLFK